LLAEILPLWLNGSITPQPQDESQAVYTSLLTKQDGLIDWHRSAVELARQVRALNPWPGCYTRWQNKQLKIVEAFPLAGGGTPGKVKDLPASAVSPVGVETADGILALVRVQLEGKNEVSAQEFIRGQRTFMSGILS
jgi:methionyl-tRNA formyltransferase